MSTQRTLTLCAKLTRGRRTVVIPPAERQGFFLLGGMRKNGNNSPTRIAQWKENEKRDARR